MTPFSLDPGKKIRMNYKEEEIYKYSLPESYYYLYTPWIEVFYDKEGENGFRWSGNRSNWWEISLKVMKHFDEIKNFQELSHNILSPNIKLIMK